MNITLVYDVEQDFQAPLQRAVGRLSQNNHIQSFDLNAMKVGYCCGCFGCWLRTPGRCAMADDMEQILRSMVAAEKVIYISRIRAGYVSSRVKAALDRFIPWLLPYIRFYGRELHHPRRYENVFDLGILLADGSPVEEETRNSIFDAFSRLSINMHAPRLLTGAAGLAEMEEKLYEMGHC